MSEVVGKTILAMLFAIMGIVSSYEIGYFSGRNEVVNACSYYKKYALDGTQFLLCSAVVKPEDMIPTVEETNAKLYSQENKDLHKKDRK